MATVMVVATVSETVVDTVADSVTKTVADIVANRIAHTIANKFVVTIAVIVIGYSGNDPSWGGVLPAALTP